MKKIPLLIAFFFNVISVNLMESDGAGGGMPVSQMVQGEVSVVPSQAAAVQSSGPTNLEARHNKMKSCSPLKIHCDSFFKAAAEGGTRLSQTIIFENTNLRSASVRESSGAKFLPSSMSRSELCRVSDQPVIHSLFSLSRSALIGSDSKSNELPFCDSVALQLGLKKVCSSCLDQS